MKTIYETHLWEGKFEVKRKIVWVLGFQAFWRCLVLGVPAMSGLLAVRRSRCSMHLCRQPCKPQIVKKGKGTRKGKERGAEEERGEAGKKKKLLKNKWREEIWSQIWRWILT